jgi:hypothetical protein
MQIKFSLFLCWALKNEVELSFVKFVGAMYGKANCTSLNALHCEKTGKKNIQGKNCHQLKMPSISTSCDVLISCSYGDRLLCPSQLS